MSDEMNAAVETPTTPTTPVAEQPQVSEEKWGAQLLRRLHEDHTIIMHDYDEALQKLEDEDVHSHVTGLLANVEKLLSQTEKLFAKKYGDEYPPLENAMEPEDDEEEDYEEVEDKDLDEESEEDPEEEEIVEDPDEDQGEEEVLEEDGYEPVVEGGEGDVPADSVSDRGEEEPTPEEAMEGMEEGDEEMGVEEMEDEYGDHEEKGYLGSIARGAGRGALRGAQLGGAAGLAAGAATTANGLIHNRLSGDEVISMGTARDTARSIGVLGALGAATGATVGGIRGGIRSGVEEYRRRNPKQKGVCPQCGEDPCVCDENAKSLESVNEEFEGMSDQDIYETESLEPQHEGQEIGSEEWQQTEENDEPEHQYEEELLPDHHEPVAEAASFLTEIGQPDSQFEDEHRHKSYHYAKTLEGIAQLYSIDVGHEEQKGWGAFGGKVAKIGGELAYEATKPFVAGVGESVGRIVGERLGHHVADVVGGEESRPKQPDTLKRTGKKNAVTGAGIGSVIGGGLGSAVGPLGVGIGAAAGGTLGALAGHYLDPDKKKDEDEKSMEGAVVGGTAGAIGGPVGGAIGAGIGHALTSSSKFLKSLSDSKDFGDPHREKAMSCAKQLNDLITSKEEGSDEDEEPKEEEDNETTPEESAEATYEVGEEGEKGKLGAGLGAAAGALLSAGNPIAAGAGAYAGHKIEQVGRKIRNKIRNPATTTQKKGYISSVGRGVVGGALVGAGLGAGLGAGGGHIAGQIEANETHHYDPNYRPDNFVDDLFHRTHGALTQSSRDAQTRQRTGQGAVGGAVVGGILGGFVGGVGGLASEAERRRSAKQQAGKSFVVKGLAPTGEWIHIKGFDSLTKAQNFKKSLKSAGHREPLQLVLVKATVDPSANDALGRAMDRYGRPSSAYDDQVRAGRREAGEIGSSPGIDASSGPAGAAVGAVLVGLGLAGVIGFSYVAGKLVLTGLNAAGQAGAVLKDKLRSMFGNSRVQDAGNEVIVDAKKLPQWHKKYLTRTYQKTFASATVEEKGYLGSIARGAARGAAVGGTIGAGYGAGTGAGAGIEYNQYLDQLPQTTRRAAVDVTYDSENNNQKVRDTHGIASSAERMGEDIAKRARSSPGGSRTGVIAHAVGSGAVGGGVLGAIGGAVAGGAHGAYQEYRRRNPKKGLPAQGQKAAIDDYNLRRQRAQEDPDKAPNTWTNTVIRVLYAFGLKVKVDDIGFGIEFRVPWESLQAVTNALVAKFGETRIKRSGNTIQVTAPQGSRQQEIQGGLSLPDDPDTRVRRASNVSGTTAKRNREEAREEGQRRGPGTLKSLVEIAEQQNKDLEELAKKVSMIV